MDPYSSKQIPDRYRPRQTRHTEDLGVSHYAISVSQHVISVPYHDQSG